MMTRNILIGLGAGLAAALLFASVFTGTTLALPLYLLSPLPIAIAGIGFGTWSGATAAIVTAVLVGTLLGPILGFMQFAVFGAPIAWGAHLVGLSRPTETAPGSIEWFPLAQVLMRVAIAATVGVIAFGAIAGFDPEALVPLLVSAVEESIKTAGGTLDQATRDELAPVVGFGVRMLPASFAYGALGVAVLNLWLGGHVARMSGLLKRPWTPMWLVILPGVAAPAFGVAFVAAFLPGGIGQIATAFAGALGFAFVLTGCGALHALLIGRTGRLGLLFLFYAASFLLMLLPMLPMAVVGIVDTLTQFRLRRLAARGAPSS